MKQARSILAILLFGCAVMAVVDGVIQPLPGTAPLVEPSGRGIPASAVRPSPAGARMGCRHRRRCIRCHSRRLLSHPGHLRFLRPHHRPHCRHRGAPGKFPLGRPLHLLCELLAGGVLLPRVRLFAAAPVSAPQAGPGAELSGLRPLPCGNDPGLVRSAGSAPHAGWAGSGRVDLLPLGRAFRQSVALLGGTPRRQPRHQCHRLPALCCLGSPPLL